MFGFFGFYGLGFLVPTLPRSDLKIRSPVTKTFAIVSPYSEVDVSSITWLVGVEKAKLNEWDNPFPRNFALLQASSAQQAELNSPLKVPLAVVIERKMPDSSKKCIWKVLCTKVSRFHRMKVEYNSYYIQYIMSTTDCNLNSI